MADVFGSVDMRVLLGLAESWAQAAGSTLDFWPVDQLMAADLVTAKDSGLLACALALRAACLAEAEKNMGQVVVTLLPDDRVRMVSTCFGRLDCSYLNLADAKTGDEAVKLVNEMRQRLPGATSHFSVSQEA